MGPLFPKSIRVMFNEFGPHLPYAVNLAELLCVPAAVFAPLPDACLYSGSNLLGLADYQLRARMHGRIESHARAYLTAGNKTPIHTHIEDSRFGDDYLFVSCDTNAYAHIPVLSPAGELKVFRGTKGPVFVPLGDGPSGIIGAQYGVQLAKRLETSVVYWHTTWRNTAITESDPRAHVTPNAEAVIVRAEAIARGAGVTHATQCVCVDDVVQGIIGAAQHAGASLVVMARGGHKISGTYTDRVRARNCPIPMLTLPKVAA